MTQQPDYVRMAEAAREQRERQEQEAQEAKTRELEAVAGEAYLEFDGLFGSDLDHPVKISRYKAATQVLRGDQASAAMLSTPVQPPSAVPFDYASLSDDQRRIIDLVATDGGRFLIEDSGAVKDKQYVKLNRNYQAEQAASQGGGSDGSSEPATPAPAKKAPAKKATSAPPRSGSTATEAASPTPPSEAQTQAPDPAPASQSAPTTDPEAQTPTPQSEEQTPSGDETSFEDSGQPTPSLRDRVKDSAKTAAARLLEPNPK